MLPSLANLLSLLFKLPIQVTESNALGAPITGTLTAIVAESRRFPRGLAPANLVATYPGREDT